MDGFQTRPVNGRPGCNTDRQFSHTPARAFIAYGSSIHRAQSTSASASRNRVSVDGLANAPDATGSHSSQYIAVFREVAEVFWGSRKPGMFSSYEGKALGSQNKYRTGTYLKDSLGSATLPGRLCTPSITANHVGDPNLEKQIFTA